jgi:hypothetical protein
LPEYCEQPIWGAWFEPFNTLTNLAFVLAGTILLVQIFKKPSHNRSIPAIYLSILLIIIGIGSFAWHLYRTRFTLMIDSIPIMIFVLSFLFLYVFRITHRPWTRLFLFLGFFIYTPLIAWFLGWAFPVFLGNGGSGYMAAISYLAVLQIFNSFYARKLLMPSWRIIGIFFLSLLFRQLDIVLCDSLSIGTHFLWHILNAVTLYLMVQLLNPQNSVSKT